MSFRAGRASRATALQSVRSKMREDGLDPATQSLETAHQVLDDLARSDRTRTASMWYREASDQQWSLFAREWKRWCKENTP